MFGHKDHHGDKDHSHKKHHHHVHGTTTDNVQEGSNVERQRHTSAPALAEEKIHHKEEVHVQDVVTRDIEKKEIRQVELPVHEVQTNATQHHNVVLQGKNIEKNLDRGTAIPAPRLPTATHTEDREVKTVTRAPIIQERVHHQIIEEVQPVVYRDVVQPHTVSVERPIHEHIVEPTTVTRTVASTIEGRSGLAPTQLNAANYQVSDLTHLDRMGNQQQGGIAQNSGTSNLTSGLGHMASQPQGGIGQQSGTGGISSGLGNMHLDSTPQHHTAPLQQHHTAPLVQQRAAPLPQHSVPSQTMAAAPMPQTGGVTHLKFQGDTLNEAHLIEKDGKRVYGAPTSTVPLPQAN